MCMHGDRPGAATRMRLRPLLTIIRRQSFFSRYRPGEQGCHCHPVLHCTYGDTEQGPFCKEYDFIVPVPGQSVPLSHMVWTRHGERDDCYSLDTSREPLRVPPSSSFSSDGFRFVRFKPPPPLSSTKSISPYGPLSARLACTARYGHRLLMRYAP